MQITDISFRKQNIVSVYKELSLDKISRDKLRNILPSETPVIQDVPNEFIILIYPDLGPLACIIGNRRVQVESENSIRSEQMVHLFIRVNKLVSPSHSLIAYGFNYQSNVIFENGRTTQLITERFLKEPERLESLLGGRLVNAEVTFDIQGEKDKIQFAIKPAGTDLILSTNVHVVADVLPNEVSLKRYFKSGYDRVKTSLSKILGQDYE